MSRGIFLIDSGDRLVEMREQPYDSEDLLQRLLASYPSLLASDQIDPVNPRKWLLVTTGSWKRCVRPQPPRVIP